MNNRYGIKYDFNENTGSFGMVIDEILDAHSSNPVANWVLKKAIEQGGGGGGSGVWGEITGTITDQTDLVNYIDSHGAGTWGSITGTLTDQTDLINYISNALNNYYTKSVVYTKTEVDDLLDDKVDASDLADVATSGDYNDLSNTPNLATVATSGDYNDLINKPTPATVNDATLTIQKNSSTVGTFTANSATDKTIDIVVPVDAADVDALPDTTKYGARLEMSIDSSTFVVTTTLKDQDGNAMGNAQTIDLPLESVVVSGSYDSANKKVVLTLKDGSTVEFSVADLVAGLQTEITSTNKLDADLVDDSTSVNKFVSGSVGTDTVPVYLDNGTITACDADFNDVAFIGDTVGTPTNEAYVATANIQDGAVTTDKIDWSTVNQNIVTAALADASVTTAKLANSAVTSAKIDWTTLADNQNNIRKIYVHTFTQTSDANSYIHVPYDIVNRTTGLIIGARLNNSDKSGMSLIYSEDGTNQFTIKFAGWDYSNSNANVSLNVTIAYIKF